MADAATTATTMASGEDAANAAVAPAAAPAAAPPKQHRAPLQFRGYDVVERVDKRGKLGKKSVVEVGEMEKRERRRSNERALKTGKNSSTTTKKTLSFKASSGA